MNLSSIPDGSTINAAQLRYWVWLSASAPASNHWTRLSVDPLTATGRAIFEDADTSRAVTAVAAEDIGFWVRDLNPTGQAAVEAGLSRDWVAFGWDDDGAGSAGIGARGWSTSYRPVMHVTYTVNPAHDVGLTHIITPTGVCDSLDVITPACSVANFGTTTESYRVRLKVGTAYEETAHVSGHAPNTRVAVTFPPHSDWPRGRWAVSCSTELAGDLNSANDRLSDSVLIRVLDAGCVQILSPTGTLDSGAVVTPACSLFNYGNTDVSYWVRLRIGTLYDQLAQVPSHAPGMKIGVTFFDFTAFRPGGPYPVTCSTLLTGDVQPANDAQTGTLVIRRVGVLDVGCVRLLAPAGSVDSGAPVTPACSVYNFGTSAASYTVRMRIGAFYDQLASVPAHGSGTGVLVEFPVWNAVQVGGPHPVTCSTQLDGDAESSNDRQLGSVIVRQQGGHDVGCVAIIAPDGIIDSGTVLAPVCSVFNYGAFPESYSVRCLIGSTYEHVADVLNHEPGTGRRIVFADSWPASELGAVSVRCSTELAGDNTPGNDRETSTVTVRRPNPDVGCRGIISPSGTILAGTLIAPACTVHNFGNTVATYQVRMRIGTAYDTVAAVVGHPPGTWVIVSFAPWLAAPPSSYAVACFTLLSGDLDPGNDSAFDSCNVVAVPGESGWVRKADVPVGGKNKRVKDGGCLAYAEEGTGGQGSGAGDDPIGYVYGLKGNNTAEFYRYNTSDNTWATRESIPVVGASGKKKRVKKGAALVQAEGRLYATKGNNTLEFWEYSLSDKFYPWTQKADVPAGVKNVREGAGMVAARTGETTFVYLLKGSNTLEFYRFNTLSNAWETRASAPAGLSGRSFKNGSCVTVSEDGKTIYALKGSYNEFFAYQVDSNFWTTKTLLPLIGSSGRKKKVKDGAGIAQAGGFVYALKGGNTQEFWKYSADSDRWIQGPDLPLGGGKRVKGGGALVAGSDGLYATKGNNTLEFWRYGLSGKCERKGDTTPSSVPYEVQSSSFIPHNSDFRLQIAPNPFSGAATISYSLPQAGNMTLKLYDVTGTLVTTLVQGYHAAGSSSFITHRSSFARGVYLLKLETETRITTSKLIIE
jgi:hypothetical protein